MLELRRKIQPTNLYDDDQARYAKSRKFRVSLFKSAI